MNTINRGRSVRLGVLLAGWLLALLATPAAVMADCLATPNAKFSVLIDASSSCSNMSANMSGCQVDPVSGSCTIPNPVPGGQPIVIQVTPADAVGSVPVAPGLVSWTATGPAELGTKLVDFSIFLGATGGGTCGWSYTPGASSDSGMAFLKSNGQYQKVNDIYFCSDFTAPPPALARLVLGKTVMRSGGTCGVDDVEVLEIDAGTEVEFCFKIENVGAGDAGSVSLGDPDVFAVDQPLGRIDAGAPATVVQSTPVMITATGEITNTASVNWTNLDDPAASTGTASDTAKLVSSLTVEACPAEYQELVDGVINGDEDFYGFAALFDATSPERVAFCAPSTASGIECRDECILKEICRTDPNHPDCVAPNYQCEPSGAWSLDVAGTCTDQRDSGGMPYCWELAADADMNCEYEPVQVMKKSILVIQEDHRNPFCYTSTTIVDGKEKTIRYCF